MMKRDFVAIAAVIQDVRDNVDCSSYSDVSKAIADRLSDYFADCNDQFDRVRFLRACGINQGD